MGVFRPHEQRMKQHKYENIIREIIHSTVEMWWENFEITTQHQFQILCKQLPPIPGKAFLCKVEIHYTQEELKQMLWKLIFFVQITVLVEKGSLGSEARGKLEPGVRGTSSKYD